MSLPGRDPARCPPKPSLATMWGGGTNGDMQGMLVVARGLHLP